MYKGQVETRAKYQLRMDNLEKAARLLAGATSQELMATAAAVQNYGEPDTERAPQVLGVVNTLASDGPPTTGARSSASSQ